MIRTLTDLSSGLYVESVDLVGPGRSAIRKRRLRGGLADGVDAVEIDNGELRFTVLPTRGMGLWRGDYRGIRLGWDSPVVGPVNPALVNQTARNNLGWLDGFDEWLCRCGLGWLGPPGDDAGSPLTLHGRIANTPAHTVKVAIADKPAHELSVTGIVDEVGFFSPRLRLTSTIRTVPGSNRLTIHDHVRNLGGQPAPLCLLYHTNFGPPLLEAGGKFAIPIKELSPFTARGAEGIDTFDTYAGPVAGYAEQNYAVFPLAADDGFTLAMLHNAAADKGCVLRWKPTELPCFTVWKNTCAVADGYVTGIEPATCFPNFRSYEREKGRVIELPPGGTWECTWHIEVYAEAAGVAARRAEVAAIQQRQPAVIHRTPQATFARV